MLEGRRKHLEFGLEQPDVRRARDLLPTVDGRHHLRQHPPSLAFIELEARRLREQLMHGYDRPRVFSQPGLGLPLLLSGKGFKSKAGASRQRFEPT